MQKKWGSQIHNQRPFILQLGTGNQRRRRRRCPRGGDKGFKNPMATNVQKLGPKLAIKLLSQRTIPFISRHRRRRPEAPLLQCRSLRLVLRPDLCRQSVSLLKLKINSFFLFSFFSLPILIQNKKLIKGSFGR